MLGPSPLLTVTIVGSALLVGGLLAVILGDLALVARGRFDLSARGEAALKGVFLAALACALFLGGLLIDRYGLKEVLVGGAVLAGFSLASLGVSRSFSGALCYGALLGLAHRLLHTA